MSQGPVSKQILTWDWCVKIVFQTEHEPLYISLPKENLVELEMKDFNLGEGSGDEGSEVVTNKLMLHQGLPII